ncbi:MAG: tryptophan-rich sensory protein [Chitinispirillaceae bacterium]|nr:tryptophan-rich sensory protein [Chitinispirillaceae bacterium]
MNQIKYNLLSIILCEIVGLSGGAITSTSVSTWYRKLRKPSFNPPSWIFGPVWTTLYAIMGIAAASIAQNREKDTTSANALFGTQLLLNFLWTVLFFGLRSPFAAFVEITVLHIAILLTISTYWRLSKKAAFLMIPYILWVSFASLLNYKVWRLNR